MKSKRIATALFVLIALLALVGCQPALEVDAGVDGNGATQEPAPVEEAADPDAAQGGPLVKVYRHGGLCLSGSECSSELLINRDGSYILRNGDEEPVEGALPAEQVDAIQAALAEADFEAIKAVPFTDTCPVAYDGQEVIYTFYVEGGEEEIAGCEVQIDPAHPLFAAVEAAVGAVAQ
jgi:hypothetical protein